MEVLLPHVQMVAEQTGSFDGLTPQMTDEDHDLLDNLQRSKARLRRRLCDMANRNFGSIFR